MDYEQNNQISSREKRNIQGKSYTFKITKEISSNSGSSNAEIAG